VPREQAGGARTAEVCRRHGIAEARAIIARWRQDYNEVPPHSAHGGLTPEAAARRFAGDRLRTPDPLRRSPATIEPAKAL